MVLLVSNSLDFATDYIVRRLLERKVEYLRIDLDLAHTDQIWLDPVRQALDVRYENRSIQIRAHELRSVLFRAPTHLSESSGDRYQPQERLQRHQWAAFGRSLMLFNCAKWVNQPQATYFAESKPVQLSAA